MVLIDILEEHLEEADFLWQQRGNAFSNRAYNLDRLAELEERLLAHLDGLVLGGEAAWELLAPKLAGGELGEVFAATSVALASGDPAQINLVQKTFSESEGSVFDGIRQALRHTSFPDIERIIRPLLNSERAAVRAAALDLISFRRMPLDRNALQAALTGKDPLLVAAAATAIGRLRIAEMKYEIEAVLESDAPQIRLEAVRAGILFKSEKALNRCRKAFSERSEEAGEAIFLLGLAGSPEDGSLLVNALGEPSLTRNAILSLGLLGRAAAMEPLIQAAADSKLARLAGDAIRALTGVDLEKEKLVLPPEAEAKKEEDEEAFEDDLDEGLPFPDPAKLEAWWRKSASRFDKKGRYRKGQPYGGPVLIDLLQSGTLPERRLAAWELASIDPSRPILETEAFAGRQKREIGALSANLGRTEIKR